MSNAGMLLIATGLLAFVAVVAAVIAVVAVRSVRRQQQVAPVAAEPAPPAPALSTDVAVRHDAPATRVVEGRVIATPTEQQVVETALGRPAVRLSILAAGLGHALRPESRDRISGLVRREYRQRRRIRRRAARRAARAVPAGALQREDSWLGTSDPAPIDLAEQRTLRSTGHQSRPSKMVGE